MTPEQSKTDRAWRVARDVSEMVYIYQSELQKHQASPDTEELISGIERLLEKHEQKWSKSQSQIIEVQAVEALTQIFKGIVAGKVTVKTAHGEIELTEEQIQMKIWQLRSHPDDPDYHDFNEAIKWPLPSKEEISEKQGPKEYALWFWEDYNKSRTTIISYGRKIKSGELKFTPLRSVKAHLEREQYIASVCVNLLQLNEDELDWIGEK